MYTVKELIEVLQKCPQDFEVLIRTETETSPIETIGIDHNENTVDLFMV